MNANGTKTHGRTLWVWDTLPQKGLKPDDQSWLKEGDAVENVHRLKLANHGKSSFDCIYSGSRPPHTLEHELDILASFVELAKPGAEIKITQVVKNDEALTITPDATLKGISDLIKSVKLAGLTNIGNSTTIDISPDTKLDIEKKFKLSPNANFRVIEIACQAPNFESGSSQMLSFAKKIQEKKKIVTSCSGDDTKKASTAEKNAIWSLDDLNDDEVDLIDPDTLIDEEDLKKPEAASLKVCGTTGKRKACKDCSCGLAEDLAEGKAITTKSVNSSCGSCYLGDAFRCASCPYLGMPAFKPGEKIQLSDRQLKADK